MATTLHERVANSETANTSDDTRLDAAETAIDAVELELDPFTAITADGAVTPGASASFVITKAGVAVLTLALTAVNGVVLKITSSTANAHTITATGLFMCGTAAVNLATFPAQAGASLILQSFNSKWLVMSNNLVVFS